VPVRAPIDPYIEQRVHLLLTVAAQLDAHVQQVVSPGDEPHILRVYVVPRTSDPEREALDLEDDDEPTLTEWLENQGAIVRASFDDEAILRKAGVLRIAFADEIAERMKAHGVAVITREDYVVPFVFADLAQA
jgi:hypothetical protein